MKDQPSGPVRAVIADDEPLARARLTHLLARYPDWQVVGECRNGAEAVDVIVAEHPDVVFLDIRMPGLDGFEVADAIAPDESGSVPAPIIVFVTAHDEFALRAFDHNAVDYLLKPVDRERFGQTIARVSHRVLNPERGTQPADATELVARLAGTSPPAQRFLVRSPRGYYFVRVADVEWVTAEGNYAALHANGRAHLVRHTMKTLETRLDPAVFVRVHRSTIVNVASLVGADSLGHGEYRLRLRSGAHVETSRRYSTRVMDILKA